MVRKRQSIVSRFIERALDDPVSTGSNLGGIIFGVVFVTVGLFSDRVPQFLTNGFGGIMLFGGLFLSFVSITKLRKRGLTKSKPSDIIAAVFGVAILTVGILSLTGTLPREALFLVAFVVIGYILVWMRDVLD